RKPVERTERRRGRPGAGRHGSQQRQSHQGEESLSPHRSNLRCGALSLLARRKSLNDAGITGLLSSDTLTLGNSTENIDRSQSVKPSRQRGLAAPIPASPEPTTSR